MPITAKDLENASISAKVKNYIKDLSLVIEEEMRKKNASGECELEFELPMRFAGFELSDENMRIIVHGTLIEMYSKGGFKVLYRDTDPAFIIIKWESMLDSRLRNHLLGVIQAHKTSP